LIDKAPGHKVASNLRRTMRLRALTTLVLFALASVVALFAPLLGLGICICCLLVYLKPEALGVEG